MQLGGGSERRGAQRAVITGALGQDASLLASLLASDGVDVIGIVRPSQINANHDFSPFGEVVALDLTDTEATCRFVRAQAPDEWYHLAAEHHSSERAERFDSAQNARMLRTNLVASCVIADSLINAAPSCRLLIAASSQMYTPEVPATPVDERTLHSPATYYGMTKAMARDALSFYRNHLGLFCGTAILFNHESTRRPDTFLSRKVSSAAARIAAGSHERLTLRDLDAESDWSSAGDVVRGLRDMLRAREPADYVFGSGQLHSVRDLVRIAFDHAGLDWTQHTDAAKAIGDIGFRRPSLVADPQRAHAELRWRAEVAFEEMIAAMVDHDVVAVSTRPN